MDFACTGSVEEYLRNRRKAVACVPVPEYSSAGVFQINAETDLVVDNQINSEKDECENPQEGEEHQVEKVLKLCMSLEDRDSRALRRFTFSERNNFEFEANCSSQWNFLRSQACSERNFMQKAAEESSQYITTEICRFQIERNAIREQDNVGLEMRRVMNEIYCMNNALLESIELLNIIHLQGNRTFMILQDCRSQSYNETARLSEMRNRSALLIQTFARMIRERTKLCELRTSAECIRAACEGYLSKRIVGEAKEASFLIAQRREDELRFQSMVREHQKKQLRIEFDLALSDLVDFDFDLSFFDSVESHLNGLENYQFLIETMCGHNFLHLPNKSAYEDDFPTLQSVVEIQNFSENIINASEKKDSGLSKQTEPLLEHSDSPLLSKNRGFYGKRRRGYMLRAVVWK